MKKILLLTLLPLLLLGCGQSIISVPPTPQVSTPPVTSKILSLDSGATMQMPQDWTVSANTPDPQFTNYNVSMPGGNFMLTEIHLQDWLKGPNPEEGYVIPHEERPKAVDILQKIYDHRYITQDDLKQFGTMAGEFLGYANIYRADITYVESKDKSYRGISFYNLQGQAPGVDPVYVVTLYNPQKTSIVFGLFAINSQAKEVVNVNKDIVTYEETLDTAGTGTTATPFDPSTIMGLDEKAHKDFQALVENTPRKDLSFGAVVNDIDNFFITLK